VTAIDPSAAQPAIGERHVARGLGTTLLARLGAVVEVVAQPLYVAMFGLASYGLYAVLWAAINLAENIFDLGMTSALQRVVPQARSREQEAAALKAALIAGVGPCAVVALAAAFAAPALAGLVNVAESDRAILVPAIRLFAAALPLWAMVEILTSALRAKQLFGPEIRLRIVWEQLIRLGLAALFFAAGWGILGLIVAHILSLGVTAILALRLVGRHYPLGEMLRADMRTMFGATLGAGLSVLPANIAQRLFGDAPPLVLNALIPGAGGASAAGLFVIVRKVSSIVQLVRTAFAYVLAPIASLAAAHDMAQVGRLYGFATRVAASVALPLALTMAGASAALMAAFDAGDSRPAVLALGVMLVARGIEAALGTALPVLQVVARYRDQLAASMIGLAAAAAIGLWLIGGSGNDALVAMVVAVSAGLVIAAAIPVAQLRLQAGIHVPVAALARGIGIGGALGLAGFAVMAALSGRVVWPVQIALMLPLSLALVWLSLRTLPHGDRAALGSVGRALRLA
jgi:O-antigen/teichoic acid export membrane protein